MMDRRRMMRITAVTGIGAAFGAPLTARLLGDARLHRVSTTRVRMGTLVTLTAVHPDAASARETVAHGFATMETLEALLSRYRPDSVVTRLNTDGLVSDAPAELLEILETARRIAELSGGAFDPTMLPLLETYRRAFEATGRPPAAGELAAAVALVDHRKLTVDGGVVRLEDPGMAITLDGIAKGFVVDRTVAVLVERGFHRVLVDAGGDVATAGTERRDGPWRVGVEDGGAPGRMVEVVPLAGGAVATSGDAIHAFTADRRHHHILDPRTGRSPEGTRSATVTASSAMLADAISTAVMVLGPREGIDLLEAIPGAEGMVVTKSGGGRLRTEGFGRPLG